MAQTQTAQKKAKVKLLTPQFQVAFPQIQTPQIFSGGTSRAAGPGETGRYSCVALFRPSNFTDKDKVKWKAIVDACNRVSIESFKKPMKELDRAAYKTPFHRGEEKEQYEGFGAGVLFFTMSAYKRRPGLIEIDGETPLDPADLYPGCYARASVNPFANVQWRSISIGMNNIQKLGDGERLDGATSAAEDFGSDPAEYGDDPGSTATGDDDDFSA